MTTTPRKRAPASRTAVSRPTGGESAAREASGRVAAEAEALASDWLVVPLGGVDIRVRPFFRWPRGMYAAFRNGGNYEAAADVVHPEDLEDWLAANVDIGELIAWYGAVVEASGQSEGESRASRRSSMRTARR